MTEYSYTQISDRKNIWRPYIDVAFGYSKTKKITPPLPSLIDSGADICMGSKDIAVWLGIKFDTSEQQFAIATANGSMSRAVKKVITLEFEDRKIQCPFFFIEGITPDQAPLLGQLGFFDQLQVCFSRNAKTFKIFLGLISK